MLSEGFGQWMRARREELDLTRTQVASQIGCAVVTLEKIERGQRRPSKQMSELLAVALKIPDDARDDFVQFSRGQGEPPMLNSARLRQKRSLPPASLPAPLTSFVNRSRELAEIRGKMLRPDVRLLTLVGPPGIGKTRMSIRVGESLLDQFADGVWFVGLAALTEPANVLPAIARVVNIAESASAPLSERLQAHLRPLEALLILDNFEQVLEAGPGVIELLQSSPKLKVIVTSREPLRLYGEHVYPMPALALPPRDSKCSVEKLASFDAIKLFVARAEAVQHGFELNTSTVNLVAEICIRLDGMPLAIELATSRLNQFTLSGLSNALHDAPLEMLVSASRDIAPHQRTMRNTIQWSFDLLLPAERQALSKLCVFVGGFTTEAADSVCELTGDDVLHTLAGRSLLERDADGRWMMLELIREFAFEALTQAGGNTLEQTRQRHAEYYARLLAEEFTDARLILVMDAEQHNAQSALRWLIDHQNAHGSHLARSLATYFMIRGSPSQGMHWLKTVLESHIALDTQSRVNLYREVTDSSWHLHDFTTALDYAHRALALHHELDQPSQIAVITMIIGRIHIEAGDYIQARDQLREALRYSRSINESEVEAGTLASLGEVELSLGNVDRAAECFDEVDVLCHSHAWRNGLWMSLVCIGKGEIALIRHAYEQAQAFLREGLSGSPMIRVKLLDLDVLAGAIGTMPRQTNTNVLRAAKIWGAVAALRDSLGMQIAPGNRSRIDALIAKARARANAKAFIDAWAAGRQLSLDEAVALALA